MAFSSRRKRLPDTSGPHKLGCLRLRLPPAPGDEHVGVLVQATYPADVTAQELGVASVPYFRAAAVDAMGKKQNFPAFVTNMILPQRQQADPPRRPKLPEEGRWPLYVFCSGLFGCCEMYTQLCRDLASHGAIVLAVEHEDRSGVYATDRRTGEELFYRTPPSEAEAAAEGITTVAWRRPFLDKRAEEIADVLATVAAEAGKPPAEGAVGEAAALAAVLQTADTQRLLLVGHSFGAAGIIHHLRRKGVMPGVVGAILADPWFEPVVEEDITAPFPVPFFLLLSQAWEESEKYLPPNGRFVQAAGDQCIGAWVVKGTAHQWISDCGFWLPGWILRRMGMMGKGDFWRAWAATITATQLGLDTILGRLQATKLQESVAALDPDALVPFVPAPTAATGG